MKDDSKEPTRSLAFITDKLSDEHFDEPTDLEDTIYDHLEPLEDQEFEPKTEEKLETDVHGEPSRRIYENVNKVFGTVGCKDEPVAYSKVDFPELANGTRKHLREPIYASLQQDRFDIAEIPPQCEVAEICAYRKRRSMETVCKDGELNVTTSRSKKFPVYENVQLKNSADKTPRRENVFDENRGSTEPFYENWGPKCSVPNLPRYNNIDLDENCGCTEPTYENWGPKSSQPKAPRSENVDLDENGGCMEPTYENWGPKISHLKAPTCENVDLDENGGCMEPTYENWEPKSLEPKAPNRGYAASSTENGSSTASLYKNVELESSGHNAPGFEDEEPEYEVMRPNVALVGYPKRESSSYQLAEGRRVSFGNVQPADNGQGGVQSSSTPSYENVEPLPVNTRRKQAPYYENVQI